MKKTGSDEMLFDDVGQFFGNPLGYVRYMYPWGEGELSHFDGPDQWQIDFLVEFGEKIKANGFDGSVSVDPIRMARSSGHGIGKSALVAWIANFLLDTRPKSRGTVTANTGIQLETRTWPEIVKWRKRGLTAHWVNISTGRGSMKMSSIFAPSGWFLSAQTCREENSEAFAGQHEATSTSFYLFDEGSAVPDKIYEVAEGGLTDGEPMMFVFGNPTRTTGRFREIFGKLSHRWSTGKIDSRTVKITNKKTLQQWVEDNGEDSDFVRVRIRGEFPRKGSTQFIPSDLIEKARGKVIHPSQYIGRPKIVGVDIARGGDDQTVIVKRQGLAVFGLRKMRELNTQTIAGVIAAILNDPEWTPDMVFLDMGNIGASVYDILVEWGHGDRVTGVWFGGAADRPDKYLNKRSEMYGNIRDLLVDGLALPDDNELCEDLEAPEYFFTLKDQTKLEGKLEMKSRGLRSPDCGDALVLTTAYPVSQKIGERGVRRAVTEYNMFSPDHAPVTRAKTDYDMFQGVR